MSGSFFHATKQKYFNIQLQDKKYLNFQQFGHHVQHLDRDAHQKKEEKGKKKSLHPLVFCSIFLITIIFCKSNRNIYDEHENMQNQ